MEKKCEENFCNQCTHRIPQISLIVQKGVCRRRKNKPKIYKGVKDENK